MLKCPLLNSCLFLKLTTGYLACFFSFRADNQLATAVPGPSEKKTNPPCSKQTESAKEPETPKSAKATTSHLQKLTAKNVDVVERAATDFFGRVIAKDPRKVSNAVTNEIVKSDIWFKFKEGYSNAVRRNVKLKDFL